MTSFLQCNSFSSLVLNIYLCNQGEISDEEFRDYFLGFGEIEDSVVSAASPSLFACHWYEKGRSFLRGAVCLCEIPYLDHAGPAEARWRLKRFWVCHLQG